jgi:hypothetical protein
MMDEISMAVSFSAKRRKEMRKVMLILLPMLIFSGCVASLPSNFVEKGQTDLSTKFLLHQRAA